MIQRITAVLIISILPLLSNAQIKAYPIDSWHSSVSFSAKFGGLVPVRGKFNQFSGTVLLNENDLTKTSATIFINTNSIDTGLGMRDNHLKSDDFFEVEKHPQIAFSSERVVREEGQLIMEGRLEMHGISKKVKIPFILVHGEQPDPWKNFRITLQGTLEINRLDFAVGTNQPTIGESVSIELVISARIFNTETIGLFNRPFGKEMVEAFKAGGIETGRKVFEGLKASGDEDAAKPSSFDFLSLKLEQIGDSENSMLATQLFVDIFPEDAEARSLLGYKYYENKQYEKAKASFKKAIAINSKESLALEMLKMLND